VRVVVCRSFLGHPLVSSTYQTRAWVVKMEDYTEPGSHEYAMWEALLARMSCQSDVTYPNNDVGAGETASPNCLIWAADFWQSEC
jgi:hypothetical protein